MGCGGWGRCCVKTDVICGCAGYMLRDFIRYSIRVGVEPFIHYMPSIICLVVVMCAECFMSLHHPTPLQSRYLSPSTPPERQINQITHCFSLVTNCQHRHQSPNPPPNQTRTALQTNREGDEAPVPSDGIKPTFTERPVIRQSDDGAKISFECRCVGDPKPTVAW